MTASPVNRHARRARLAGVVCAVFLAPWHTAAPAAQAPSPAAPPTAEAYVRALASDDFEGRMTGSPGELKAADYIADALQTMGARPLPGQAGVRLPFRFAAGVTDGGTTLSIEGGADQEWRGSNGVQALSFSETAQVSGPVVFAGYGLSVPDGQDFGYDSYATLDVKDKIVVVLRFVPGEADKETQDILNRYSALRYKAFAARERGAKALLVVTGPRSPGGGELVPMTFDSALSGSGIVAASISGEVARALFARVPGTTLEDVQRSLDTGNPHVAGFEIPDTRVALDVKINRESREGHNVVGYLPPTGEGATKPYVLLGAHFDHLGRGLPGSSLARKGEERQIHHGADDNASGVAAVLAVGAALARKPHRRGIVLAFWSGEELGLLGSADFVKSAPVPMRDVAAYLNFDMVGRMRNNKLLLQAVGTSTVWPPLIEQANRSFRFDLQVQNDPYLPTDVMSLNQASVPSMAFFTGSHEDYHRPTDVATTINYPDLERIAQFATVIAEQIANAPEPPDFITYKRPADAPGDRAAIRAYTGTIPDYGTEVEGLRLSGVVGDGPADQAGLREGDVIVEFGGKAIKNIYDYTYALEAVKVDVPIKIVVLRDGKKVEVTMTPRQRK